MTPTNRAIRNSSSLLLGVYSLASEITSTLVDDAVDVAVEEPVWLVHQCCRRALENLAKEES